MRLKHTAWSEEEIHRLKKLVALGASALRASVVLQCSLKMIKRKARDVGTPFFSHLTKRDARSQQYYARKLGSEMLDSQTRHFEGELKEAVDKVGMQSRLFGRN